MSPKGMACDSPWRGNGATGPGAGGRVKQRCCTAANSGATGQLSCLLKRITDLLHLHLQLYNSLASQHEWAGWFLIQQEPLVLVCYMRSISVRHTHTHTLTYTKTHTETLDNPRFAQSQLWKTNIIRSILEYSVTCQAHPVLVKRRIKCVVCFF